MSKNGTRTGPKTNEYGDCYDCDGERIVTCSCQDEQDENDTSICIRCGGRGLATCSTCA